MGVSGKLFGGRSHVTPGAKVLFNAPDGPPGVGEELFTQLIIGTCKNGPNCLDSTLPFDERYIAVSNFEKAKKIMRDGELLEAVSLAGNPSNTIGFTQGPQKFILLNVNQTTKAYRDFDTNSANALVIHRLSYPIAGPWGKKVRIKKNSDKTIEIGDSDGVITSPVLENLLATVSYIGDGTAATMQLTSASLVTTLTSPEDGSANLNIDLTEFKTVGEIVDYINSQTGYVAELIGDPGFLSSKLDAIESTAAVDIKTAPKNISADLESEILWIESTGYAEFTTVHGTRKPLEVTTVPLFLTEGGASAAPGAGALKDATDFAKKFKAFYRNMLGGNFSDKLYFKSVGAELISTSGDTETFCGVGGDLVLTLLERREEARSLGAYWTNYGVEKFYGFGLDGKEKIFPGYMLSVIDNAISASGMPRQSPTWKGLATVLRSAEMLDDERNAIIRDGGLALMVNPSSGAWVIARSVTTERKDNIILNEKSSVTSAMYMVKRLREGFNSQFIGQVPVDERATAEGVTIMDVIGYVERQLEEFVQDGFLIGSSVLAVEAFKRNFGIKIDGDTWSFTDLEGNVVLPINFIFGLLTLKPLQGSGING
ncbi:hypothetical protein [Leptospira sp. GIMC2001]|uniref:hypothetical protein n=1 Tax=Leptospira sp. GIMC2001 TaxID=1513297 RepID=UPI00234AD3B2|nr:hypothetical protein [Leptospira sp. GIMC2001]WCL51520.1 hypothetical protein O4O04_20095 [Leptospira sp. GIMC2001]